MRYIQTREETLNSFLGELCPFLELEFLVKIKSSYSRASARACDALVNSRYYSIFGNAFFSA